MFRLDRADRLSWVLTESFERVSFFAFHFWFWRGLAWLAGLGWAGLGWAGLGWAGLGWESFVFVAFHFWIWQAGACKAGPALSRHTISIYPVLRV